MCPRKKNSGRARVSTGAAAWQEHGRARAGTSVSLGGCSYKWAGENWAELCSLPPFAAPPPSQICTDGAGRLAPVLYCSCAALRSL
jgi:hypothetical protein